MLLGVMVTHVIMLVNFYTHLILDTILILFVTDGNDVGCLGANYCPPSCSCTGTIVRCSHAKLTKIPKGIPPETSELYLDVNEITSIESHRLEHLKSLTRLDLSNNKVSVLPPYVFANLTRLATLIVSYNKLQCVQENAFGGLANPFSSFSFFQSLYSPIPILEE